MGSCTIRLCESRSAGVTVADVVPGCGIDYRAPPDVVEAIVGVNQEPRGGLVLKTGQARVGVGRVQGFRRHE